MDGHNLLTCYVFAEMYTAAVTAL